MGLFLIECPVCKEREHIEGQIGSVMEPVEVGSNVYRCSICGTIGQLQQNAPSQSEQK